MREIEPKVPDGMRLLPALPTLHDVLRYFGKTEWVRFSTSFVNTLNIPDAQKDFLLWPGLPKHLEEFVLKPVWNPEIKFCFQDKQQHFSEFYLVFESEYHQIYMERFTGFLWDVKCEDTIEFVSSGLEEFLFLMSLGVRYCIRDGSSIFDIDEIYEDIIPGINHPVNFGDEDDCIDDDDFIMIVHSIDFRQPQSVFFSETDNF